MNKKLLFVLLMCFVMFSFLLVGCGDDDDNNNNGGNSSGNLVSPEDIDVDNYNYFVTVLEFDFGSRKQHMVNVSSLFDYEKSEITDLELKINNETINMMNYEGFWSGLCDLTEGQTYQIWTKCNGHESEVEMKIVHAPTENFPEDWDPAVASTFNWSLAGDNPYQYFEGSSYDWENDDEDIKFIQVASSARSYNVPANWLTHFGDESEYYFGVGEFDYKTSGETLYLSIGYDEAEYGMWIKERKPDVKKIVNNIKELIVKF